VVSTISAARIQRSLTGFAPPFAVGAGCFCARFSERMNSVEPGKTKTLRLLVALKLLPSSRRATLASRPLSSARCTAR
jgi:hypothetical protein